MEVKSNRMGGAALSVATSGDVEAIAGEVARLKRIVGWGFSGGLAVIVALMIALCDSALKTRLDKVVEYAALSLLMVFFFVAFFVVASQFQAMRRDEAERRTGSRPCR